MFYLATLVGQFFSRPRIILACIIAIISIPVHAKELSNDPNIAAPVTGQNNPKLGSLDTVMLKYLKEIGCTTATLSVSDKNQILLKRGYGWQDRQKSIPTNPNIMIGIASCDKPIIAAGIRTLARQKKLRLDAKLFDVLMIQPQGSVVDKRFMNITINNLLDNKAGWGSDPRTPAVELAKKAGFSEPVPIEILLGFIMTQPLKNEPGSTSEYCNFSWDILRFIILKLSRKTFPDYVCNDLLGMSKVKGIHSDGQPDKNDVTSLVWNAPQGGPTSASTETLQRFMHRYWLTGEPRQHGNPYWVMYGSLDGSTSMMVWRSDGINLVALFNGRNPNVTHDQIKNELEDIINKSHDNNKDSLTKTSR